MRRLSARPGFPIPRRVLLLLALLAFTSAPSRASWSPSGLELFDYFNKLEARIIEDGTDGLLVWRVTRGTTSGPYLNIDRIDSLGDRYPNWYVGSSIPPYLGVWCASDGFGGLYELRPTQTQEIYLRRILASGGTDPAWPATGVLLCDPSEVIYSQTVVADAESGAFVGYSGNKTRVKRVLPNGDLAPGWPAAGRLLDSSFMFWSSGIRGAPDGAGGAIFFWGSVDYLKAQRITASSAIAPGWPAEGMWLVPLDQAADFKILEVIPGAGHWIVAWYVRPTSGSQRVEVLKIDMDGNPAPGWGAACQPVSGTTFESLPRVVTDGSGGVWVGWRESGGVRGSHVRSDGVKDLDGIPLLEPATPAAGKMELAAGSSGGLIVFWSTPAENLSPQILRARWLLANGTADPSQPPAGRVVDTLQAEVMHALSDRSGGAYVLWARYLTFNSRLAWLPYPAQTLGVPPATRGTALSLAVSPNPAAYECHVRFTLPSPDPARLELFDLAGRRVRGHAVAGAGEHLDRFESLGDLAPGVYVVRLTLGRQTRVARVVLMR